MFIKFIILKYLVFIFKIHYFPLVLFFPFWYEMQRMVHDDFEKFLLTLLNYKWEETLLSSIRLSKSYLNIVWNSISDN